MTDKLSVGSALSGERAVSIEEGVGRVPLAPGLRGFAPEPPTASQPEALVPSRDHDPYWDYEEDDCANCHGDGFVYGCSWDWQCSTYDEGEGTCLCARRCDWCSPSKPAPELRAVLAEALDPDNTSPSYPMENYNGD